MNICTKFRRRKKMPVNYNNIIIIVFTLLIKECLVLTINKVTIPKYPVRGQSVILECDFEIGNDILYSVKWYRDNEEFYRYLPKNKPAHQSFKLDGIKVDVSKSDEHHVVLLPVTLKSSGNFRCEVSAEGPSFHSAQGEGRMEVIYLPKEGPRITGKEQEYRNGDSISLNCTSGKSYPASILSWYINDEKVVDPLMLVEYPPTSHAHGLLTTVLGLKVPTGRTLNLRCTARVAPTAIREGREAMIGEAALDDSKEAMLLVRSIASRGLTGNLCFPVFATTISLIYFYQR